MTDLWVPGIEHRPTPGAGLGVGPGAAKFVLHTTETDADSLETLIRHFQGNWGAGLPHYLVQDHRIVQLLPLNVNAYTLANKAGGVDTNRAGLVIQAEVISRAANDWNDATYTSVGRMLGLTVKAGVRFDLRTHPRFYGANEGIVLATPSSPVRMTGQQWFDFNGWCAHQHAPENDHWDCGKKDTARIEAIAVSHAGQTPAPKPPPLPTEEDDMKAIWYRNTDDKKSWLWTPGTPAQQVEEVCAQSASENGLTTKAAPQEVPGAFIAGISAG